MNLFSGVRWQPKGDTAFLLFGAYAKAAWRYASRRTPKRIRRTGSIEQPVLYIGIVRVGVSIDDKDRIKSLFPLYD